MSTSSLYSTTPDSGNVSAKNYTTLYSNNATPAPNASGNVYIAGNLTVRDGLILRGSVSGQVEIIAPAIAGNQLYTLPTAQPTVANQVMVCQPDGTMSWVNGSAIGALYNITATTTTGGANFNLVGSDVSTDTIKFTNGTGVTVTAVDDSDIRIAIGQDVATTASPTFNTVHANLVGNVTGTVSSLSNHTTNDLVEGSTNLYFTTARARNSVSATHVSGDGDLTYNSTTGVFSYTGPTNINYRGALSGGTGVTYNSTTGVISIGQDVSTSSTVTFNTVNANLTGNVTGTVSSLSNHTTTDLAEGTNLYYTNARSRAALSAGTGISYNSTTGVISSTITQYTDAMARAALSVTSSGDGSLAYNNTTGVFTYTGPSATNYRASLSGGTGVTYNSSTGVIAIGQSVATTANVTFGSVSTGTIKAADGTTALTLANTTGDVTTNRYLQINGNRILNSAGTPTFYFDTSGNAAVANNFTVEGNTIRSWNGTAGGNAILLDATNNGNVTVVGDLIVGGSDIKAADGTTALTLANTTGDVTTNRYLQINGNRILNSSGSPSLYFNTSGDVSVANDLTVIGNDIKAWNGSAAVTAITMSATGDVTTAGNLTVGGNTIKTANGTTAMTLTNTTGDVTFSGDIAVNGGDITTTAGIGNLYNTGPATVNIGNAATTEVNIGNNSSGRVQIKSPTIVGANTSQDIFNTVATTVNAFGAATSLNMGASSGLTTINNSLLINGGTGASSDSFLYFGDAYHYLRWDYAGTHFDISQTLKSYGDVQAEGNFQLNGGTTDKNLYVYRGGTLPMVAIRWNETTDQWQFTNNGTAWNNMVINLNDLGDVVITSPQQGQLLHYDGTNWINSQNIVAVNDYGVPNFTRSTTLAAYNNPLPNIHLTRNVTDWTTGSYNGQGASIDFNLKNPNTDILYGRLTTECDVGGYNYIYKFHSSLDNFVTNDNILLTIDNSGIQASAVTAVDANFSGTFQSHNVNITSAGLNLGSVGQPYTTSNVTTQIYASTSQQTFFAFPAISYRTCKMLLQFTTNSLGVESVEIMVITDGTNAYVTAYNDIRTNGKLADIDADVSGGNVRILITPTTTNHVAVVGEYTLVSKIAVPIP
jgi:hypothetical protein